MDHLGNANAIIRKDLLDAAVAAGTRRIVLVSSFAMYSTAALPKDGLLDESCALETTGLNKGAYAFVKVQQEHREPGGRIAREPGQQLHRPPSLADTPVPQHSE